MKGINKEFIALFNHCIGEFKILSREGIRFCQISQKPRELVMVQTTSLGLEQVLVPV